MFECMHIDTCHSSSCDMYVTSLAAVAGLAAVSIVYSIVITLVVMILYIDKRRKKIK